MAKGARGGRRSDPSGSITTSSGEVIEFDGKLTYGKNDAAIPTAARTAIEVMENKIVKRKVEYGYSVNADGTPSGEAVRGSKGSVRTPISYHGDGKVFTHNHPRDDGMLGGSFSDTDINSFVNHGTATKRAVAKEGTYSISRGKNFDGDGLKKYVAESKAKRTKIFEKEEAVIRNQYYSKTISYDDYAKTYKKIFNNYLLSSHNDFLAGQKTYGYTYTLEKRK